MGKRVVCYDGDCITIEVSDESIEFRIKPSCPLPERERLQPLVDSWGDGQKELKLTVPGKPKQ